MWAYASYDYFVSVVIILIGTYVYWYDSQSIIIIVPAQISDRVYIMFSIELAI